MGQEIQETMGAFGLLGISKHATTKSSYDDSKVIDIDENVDRSLLCPDLASAIFDNLRASECKEKRPQRLTQPDENRGYYVDWFVDIVEELGFSKETLYSVVRYFDSCLMGKGADERGKGLLSLACLILASKYEEVRDSCPRMTTYETRYNFSRQQIVDMERSVLKCLGYQLSKPTTWSFMERFIKAAAQGGCSEFWCLASYMAELSLYSYNMNSYLPSMVAASSIFLAKYILHPSKTPWTPTLQHYTRYQSSDLRDCVLELHDIATGRAYNFSGIREKYSRLVYCRVALKKVPLSIPVEFFGSSYLDSYMISMAINVKN